MKISSKRCCVLVGLLLCTFSTVFSQFKIRFRILSQPTTHPNDSIFAAGNFNNWQPAKSEYIFTKEGDFYSLQINDVPAGIIEFKCTRGGWEKSECAADGSNTDNHLVKVSSDTAIDFSIAAWKDDFPIAPKQHTASPNVHIVDTAFVIPQLGTKRKIWIYLPKGYATSKKRYPVMYLQDGQNIFDDYTSYAGEWGVDESLDSLIAKGAPACIVVAIDNGPERMQEYNPYEFQQYGKGKGDQYADFLAHTLKPFIDKHYRTMSSNTNTIIAGSSLGGLIAYYAMIKYPNVFDNGGIFSPSFLAAEQIKALTDSDGNKLSGKLFFYMGGLEPDEDLEEMNKVIQKLGEKSSAMIYAVIDAEGRHHEKSWRKWFIAFYKFIMADGFNNVTELEK
jgi:predicted alpha/beta superfamily hydrolase